MRSLDHRPGDFCKMSECEECFSLLFAVEGQPESGELIQSGSEKLESGELTPSLCFDKGLVFVESGKGHTDLDCFTFNLAYYV